MTVSIVIPTYNRHRILVDTLEHLLKQKEDHLEIVLVDQSKEIPDSFLQFCQKHSNIKYFRLNRPNTPNARNYGVKQASGDLIIFLDDDILPAPDLIRAHLKNYSDSSIDGVTGRVASPQEKNLYTAGRSNLITKTGKIIPNWTSKIRGEVNTVAGGNCSFKRELIKKTGYFDDNFIGNAMREESDFALRFVKKGYKIIFDPKAAVIHLAIPSGGSRTKSRIDWYFDFFHNEYLFFLKHFPRIYLPLFFFRKLRPILACIFYYGKVKPKAIRTPYLAFKAGQQTYRMEISN